MDTKENEIEVMSRGELARRYLLVVASLKATALSLGSWLILWNFLLIAGQILLLRRRFSPVQLLQVPLFFLFGWFTDLGVWLAGFLPVSAYPVRLGLVVLGTLVLALGVSLSVVAGVIMNSGEAFVKALADTTGKRFGDLKIAFDVVCVLGAVALSLLFFHFTVQGTREGTVIAALCTGFFVNLILGRVRQPLERLLRA